METTDTGQQAQQHNGKGKQVADSSYPADIKQSSNALVENELMAGCSTTPCLSNAVSMTSLPGYDSTTELLGSSTPAQKDSLGLEASVGGSDTPHRKQQHPMSLKVPLASLRKAPESKLDTIFSPTQSTPINNDDAAPSPAQPKVTSQTPSKSSGTEPPAKPSHKGSVDAFLVSTLSL